MIVINGRAKHGRQSTYNVKYDNYKVSHGNTTATVGYEIEQSETHQYGVFGGKSLESAVKRLLATAERDLQSKKAIHCDERLIFFGKQEKEYERFLNFQRKQLREFEIMQLRQAHDVELMQVNCLAQEK